MLYVDGLFSEGQKAMERSAFGRAIAADCTILSGSKAPGTIMKTSQSAIISYGAIRI